VLTVRSDSPVIGGSVRSYRRATLAGVWDAKGYEMVLVREILVGIPPDILAGLGTSVAVPDDYVVRHLTVAVIGGVIQTPVASPTCPTIG
jgi:hypothetical protein